MERITGIGGIFFKSENPGQLSAWHAQNLGIELQTDGTPLFSWRERENPDDLGSTVSEAFPADTKYFGTGGQPYMFNYRVGNLDAMLEQLRAAGATVDDKIEMLYE